MKNHVVHEFTDVKGDRKHCQPSSRNHMFKWSAFCGKRATWSRDLELVLGPHTPKCALDEEINTPGATKRCPLVGTPSMSSCFRLASPSADLSLVTFLHVGADTPHILQTHLSSTVQMPRRDV